MPDFRLVTALLIAGLLAGCLEAGTTSPRASRNAPNGDAPEVQSSGTFEIAVDVSGGGEVVFAGKGFACASSCTFKVTRGDSVDLNARPRSGYAFKQWRGACGGGGGACNVRALRNLSIDATFEAKTTDGSTPAEPSEPDPSPTPAPSPAPAPSEVGTAPPTATSDLAFVDVTGEVLGGGSCAPANHFDYDFMDANGDGLDDLFVFSHEGVEHCLYVQKRDGSGTFGYVSGEVANYRQEKIPPRGSSRATFIDLDGDGLQEITTTEADILSALFPNETGTVGGTPRYGTKVEWCSAKDLCTVGDLDGDDRLDKVRGDRSVQSIVSGKSVLGAAGAATGTGWYVVDIDGDSWPDLVDVSSGGYWRNVSGALSWQAVAGFARCTAGRHQDFADFDNDGDLDIACSSGEPKVKNSGGSRHLLRNEGSGRFTDVTAGSGFEWIAWLPYYSSYSNSYAADLDNDGWIDYVTSGSSYSNGVEILRNVGGMKFELQALQFEGQFAGGGGKPRVDVADYDHDGWLDLLMGRDEAPSVRLYRNVTSERHNWVKVRLRGAGHNTGGLNATVRLYRAGTQELLGSYQVLNHPDGQMHRIHAGLGEESRVDIEIVWPHGAGEEWLRSVDANQEIAVSYRAGGSDVRQGWKPGDL